MEHKPIYLDGVDVSGCRHFLKDTEGQDYNTDEFIKGCCEAKGSCIGYDFAGYGLCRGDKDCYFKQLARKTQECELAEQLIAGILKILNLEAYDWRADQNEIITEIRTFEEKYEEVKEDRYNLNMEMYVLDRYRKALEEIEKHIESYKEQCNIPNNCVDNRLCSTCFLGGGNELGENILDIINKAKGEGNVTF